MSYLSRIATATTFVLVFASMALGLDGLTHGTVEAPVLSGNALTYLP